MGVVFHVVYLFSIFDIYFKSPLVHGMTPHQVKSAPPADRLVLFVGDGLRADKLFQKYDDEPTGTKAPFLRDIARNKGTWGVSHTRVPTESRPGHVAIIAGFYEDVSAVTTGWTMNPVNFDSVFNESTHTWSFGSPDILPMFQHGASDPDSVETFMYDAEAEDFSQDTWVFEKVEDLFLRAAKDKALDEQLRSKKIVFFLHLLGLDTNGHAFRPHSKEYIENIALVDRGIKKTVDLIENFYRHDGRTSYVFTADHGMNNRGGHGDGHPDNTRTPILAWGAGINGPNEKNPTGHDEFSADWGLSDVQRNDIKQADIAPLMASLVGLNYPLNSVGKLPLVYLDNTPQFKAESALVNAIQIYEQYKVKHDEKKATELFFKEYAPLSEDKCAARARLDAIERLIEEKDYEAATAQCMDWIDRSLAGLRYFQTYDWLFLRSIVSAGYVGWIVYSLSFVLDLYVFGHRRRTSHRFESPIVTIAALAALGGLYMLLWLQKMPYMYYAYVIFPVYFWSEVLRRRQTLVSVLKLSTTSNGIIKTGIPVIGTIIGMEMMVVSFFRREIISACFILGAVWPLLMPSSIRRQYPGLASLWSLSCMATSTFTLLPVEKGEDVSLVLAGTAAIIITGLIFISAGRKILYPVNSKGLTVQDAALLRKSVILVASQLTMVLASGILVYDTVRRLAEKKGLPLPNQVLSWAIFGSSILVPFLYDASHDHYLKRLCVIFLGFAPTMILLSISYETLFYYSYCTTLVLWLVLERKLYMLPETASARQRAGAYVNGDGKTEKLAGPLRMLQAGDARTVMMFVFFIHVGFFGTGNVASLSSFSLESVYRFTTVFNPFLMGALLILKILVPFLVESAIFGVLTRALQLPAFSLFLLVVSITDISALNFFYLVRDDGSWLEIGTSISHFCISELFIIFIILLFWLSRALVGNIRVHSLE
ncbi:hypothetical protein BZG36_02247 [Bifiguratus adelaidae]|uniref:GPI ethanolamine phosphate transferase 1 n=1 Tax=Bifiguratus adelaidae TaxID=1938954 RepID=A0A261Y1P0_9FUNG|nr:hypothetical protein BZG36_02247 [Bifiguratus adelaidae]